MGSSNSSQNYMSIRNANFCQNIKRDIENLEARIALLKKEGKSTAEEERVLELAISELKKLESK